MKMQRGIRVCVLSGLLTLASPAALWGAESQPVTAGGKAVKTDNGTEIIGDQDSAVGLFLTPWKNETAADIDRAPGLFDAKSGPVDPKVFAQKIENDDALAAYRRSRTQSNR
jgi:hypothetical protein